MYFRILLSLIVLAATVRAQDDIDIAPLSWSSETQAQLEFTVAPDVAASRMTVEVNRGLGAAEWRLFGDATLTALGGGLWRVSLPVPSGMERSFYRVLKDGVPLETPGTATEGEPSGVQVTFSKPFQGSVQYTLRFSNGSPEQSGTVTIDGLSGWIPVVVPDDTEADTLHHVTVTLRSSDGTMASQTVATGSPMTLVIDDNDVTWSGLLSPDDEDKTIGISIGISESASESSQCLKADTTSVIPLNSATTDGCWPFTSLTSTTTSFSGVVHYTVPATDTIYQADTQMTLTLTGTTVSDRRIDGNFTLSTSVPTLTHLQFPVREGTFILFKQPGTPPLLEAPAQL